MNHPLQLKARFTHVFSYLHQNGEVFYRRIREENRKQVMIALGSGSPLSARDLTSLTTFPEIAYDLAPAILRSEEAIEQLKAYPGVLFYVLIGDYDAAAARLEPFIVGEGDGENIYRLLRWADRRGVTLKQSRAAYENWLARDPYWAGLHLADKPSSRLATLVAEHASRYHLEDAGAAYAYLQLHPDVAPEKYARVLSANPFYLLLAILGSGGRITTRLLLREHLNPRWAYHLAQTTGCADRSQMEEVMQDDVGWLLEYYVDCGMAKDRASGRRIAEVFLASIKKHDSHCCKAAAISFINRLAASFQPEVKKAC